MFDWEVICRTKPLWLSVVGMAKNVGKTVTFNYVYASLTKRGQTVGLTSIGRDGEKLDALTNLPKPPIEVQRGTLLATAEQVIERPLCWELLQKTGLHTPLGEVLILKAKESTAVVLAGPSMNHEVGVVLQLLEQWGASCILIDGAFDRQSSVDPLVSTHVILASGATLSRSMEEVITMTKCRAEQLMLPPCHDRYLELYRNSRAKVLLGEARECKEIEVPTTLLSKENWLEILGLNCSFIIVKGAVAEGLGEAIYELDTPPLIIVQDGSKLFIEPWLWKKLKAKQVIFQACQSINLLGITINPTLPGEAGFDPEALLEGMGKALYPLPVIDVVRGERFKL